MNTSNQRYIPGTSALDYCESHQVNNTTSNNMGKVIDFPKIINLQNNSSNANWKNYFTNLGTNVLYELKSGSCSGTNTQTHSKSELVIMGIVLSVVVIGFALFL